MSYSERGLGDKTPSQTQITSNIAHRTARERPKTLDLGLGAVESRQPRLYVTKPSQIGVGWFLAECMFGVFQLPI